MKSWGEILERKLVLDGGEFPVSGERGSPVGIMAV
jgi:hypothetical protein